MMLPVPLYWQIAQFGTSLLGLMLVACLSTHCGMAEEPPSGIVRFVNGNSVNPSFKSALPAKASDISKYFQEDFLNYIRGFGRVVQQPQSQGIHGLLEPGEQIFISPLGAVAQALHQPEIFDLGYSLRRSFRTQVQY